MASPSRPAPRSYLAATPDFAAGKDSPATFLERCLADLDAREPQVQAFVCHDAHNARVLADAASRRWKEGRPLSAIDGMPLGVKDVIETADMPTGMGSPLFTGWRSGSAAIEPTRTTSPPRPSSRPGAGGRPSGATPSRQRGSTRSRRVCAGAG